MKKTFLTLLVLSAFAAQGQMYELRKSDVSFFSEAPLENIAAKTESASGLFDAGKRQIAFAVKINSFKFDKKLMQEHFNEKYMESDKFPNASFSANVINFDPAVSGVQSVIAKGKFTIHGVTREVEVPGRIEILPDGQAKVSAAFKVKLEDYDITRPKLVWQNIAEVVDVKVDFLFQNSAK